MENISDKILNIKSNGIETCRYNSAITIEHSSKKELILYSCGNNIILMDAYTEHIISKKKLFNEAIMVIY